MKGEMETPDNFLGAYLLCSGCDLIACQPNESGQVVYFFEGETAVALDRSFSTSRGMMSPLQLRETMSMLKDMFFEKGRTESRR